MRRAELIYVNRQSMTSESHIASIEYRGTIVVRSFIRECDVSLERYRTVYTKKHSEVVDIITVTYYFQKVT